MASRAFYFGSGFLWWFPFMRAPLLDQFSQVSLVSHNDIEEFEFREVGRVHYDMFFH